MRNKAPENDVINRDILEERDVFYLCDEKVISLSKLKCKDYYNLFQEKEVIEPTTVKNWSRVFPHFAHSWKQTLHTIHKMTVDNKLREFGFKILHRILMSNKELKRFKTRNDDICSQCKNPDSLDHTFLECPVNVIFYQEILSWFNAVNGAFINLSAEQILFHNYLSPLIDNNLRRRLDLLILLIKKYIYSCKINELYPDCSQFINKLKMQWKIENLL